MHADLSNEALHEMYRATMLGNEPSSETEALVQALRQNKLVIYGGGALGQLLANTLALYGIQPYAFVDRAADRMSRIDCVPVYGPERLSERSPDLVVIIAMNMESQYNTLSDAVRDLNPSLRVLDGFVMNRVLRYHPCLEERQRNEPCDLIRCENCGFERRECPLALSSLKKAARAAAGDGADWRSGAFDWFGYIVGQVCTLRCVHCCEAVPFLKEHAFVDSRTIVSDVQKVAQSCRFLKFVELIGGEPFAHPEFERTLRALLEIENIGYIKVFTNATIVPDDSLCEVLKEPRVMLQVSNYEEQASSRVLPHILATRSKLAEKLVSYIFTPNIEWRDFSTFDLRRTEVDTLKRVFPECPLSICHRLHKGTLYRCPHHYAGVQLGKLKKLDVECVDIDKFDNGGLAKALEAFENVSYIDACQYCTMPFDAAVVRAGEQLQ